MSKAALTPKMQNNPTWLKTRKEFVVTPNGKRVYISYEKLRIQMAKKRWTIGQLGSRAGLATQTLAAISRNMYVSFAALAKIAMVMDCTLDEIVEIRDTPAEDYIYED